MTVDWDQLRDDLRDMRADMRDNRADTKQILANQADHAARIKSLEGARDEGATKRTAWGTTAILTIGGFFAAGMSWLLEKIK